MITLFSTGRSFRVVRPRIHVVRSRMFGWALSFMAMALLVSAASRPATARPSAKNGKQSGEQIQAFLRQLNVYSNIEFYYTNRGVDFNSGGLGEGCFWPRGSGDSYIFGGGLWFATEKDLQGKPHKLCELGYNPNSGAGWYMEGEASQVGLTTGSDGSTPSAKYISYVGPRYDKTSGKYIPGSSSVVPNQDSYWPLWDTSATKTLNRNYYFGDYVSDVGTRKSLSQLSGSNTPLANGKVPKPALTSEEDIVNFYSDQDPSNNPEFRQGTGYPFGIDIQEEIYSWSFGRYRDMIFERHKVTNNSSELGSGAGDTLIDCYMAPAYDPDLDDAASGAAQQDGNSYVNSSLLPIINCLNPVDTSQLREPYRSDLTKLNMGVQWRNYGQPPNGQQYGWIGFSFLESPVKDSAGNIIANDDSAALHGYCANSLFQKNQLGLTTFKDWTILNDPSTEDLRYNFVSSGEKDLFNGVYYDQRLLMATGPFTLLPGKPGQPGQSVETIVAITIAQVDNKSYEKNFAAVLLLTDFAHEVFGEIDSTAVVVDTGTPPKPDTTGWNCSCNHFLSPTSPNIPQVSTTALDKAVLVHWDTAAEITHPKLLVAASLLPDTTLSFMGYQLWRSTRSDHDSTIRPDGNNPDVMLGQWQLYNFTTDSVFDASGHFNHLHYKRTNTVPNPIPHNYLDVGDDTHTGVLTSAEGLNNNVTYYYYVIAFSEYDSLNKVGPLYTAIVPPKNFVPGTPNKPAFLVPFNADTSTNIAGNCQAGSGNPKLGGVVDVRLNIADTGIFAKLFTNDTINVSFQPQWTEDNDAFLAQSPLIFHVDVTDTKLSQDSVRNTYANLQNPANNTTGYSFPLLIQPGTTLVEGGSSQPDSIIVAQFTTDNPAFAPNQTIDHAFSVLADVNLEQLGTPYRLNSVTVIPGPNNPTLSTTTGILRLSERTNNNLDGVANQSIYNLPTDTDATRPSFLGALGETSYQVTFGNVIGPPGPVQIILTDGDTLYPRVMPITVTIDPAICPNDTLRLVKDTATDMTEEFDYHFYHNIGATAKGSSTPYLPLCNDPDTMYVPNPGWYEMAAFHYTDAANFTSQHSSPSINLQGPSGGLRPTSGGSVGPYYFPMGGNDNIDNGPGAGGTPAYHVVVHKLSVGGAEIIFNAPEIADPGTTGDTIAGSAGHTSPNSPDFAPGDKVMLSFTGLMKNLPFPGAKFSIKTESGPPVSFLNSSNYVNSILAQVQVVPNPYIATNLAQISTDEAKLFFTRLPPRCTIEIYALDGTLVKTIEHIGYQSTVTQDTNDLAQTTTTYHYNQLSDQTAVEVWNLQTSGLQLVGSQVLFARVIAKDPNSGAEIGEITTKFGVVVGLSK